MKRIFKFIGFLLRTALCLLLAAGVAAAGINLYMCGSVQNRMISQAAALELEDVDCILVLGCSVLADGTPSAMLQERLNTGIALLEAGVSDVLLMSGDHRQGEYDEVDHMKEYAVDSGVEPERVLLDKGGFSTYESMYRAARDFQVRRAVIVTQKYHLYRAVYDARQMGIDAYGVAAGDERQQKGDESGREILARIKDFVYTLLRLEP